MLPGHEPMKDRLTLLMCGKASADLKVKQLLVYHSDNHQVFMLNHVMKSKLPIMLPVKGLGYSIFFNRVDA